MKARRIRNVETPAIGHTIVTMWWPDRHFVVLTLQTNPDDPLNRLTASIEQTIPFAEAESGPPRFVTEVRRCDKQGVTGDDDLLEEPLYQQEHPDLQAAKSGHAEVVDKLASGKLR